MFAVSDVAREGVGAYNGAVVAGTDTKRFYIYTRSSVSHPLSHSGG